MKTVAVTNQKGGVGKTTTAHHLAVALAERGHRVLAVDLDPQANLTMASGLNVDALGPTMYQVLVSKRSSIIDVIQPTTQGFDLAPADPDLGTADVEMVVGKLNWHLVLRRELATLRSRYDWCVLDCPPSLSALTVNALQAADGVLIPVSPEMWPIKGMQRLFLTIEEMREGNPDLEVVAIVPTLVRRDKAQLEMLERMHRLFEHAHVTSPVAVSAQFSRAAREVTSVLHRSPKSGAAATYREVAEVVEKALSRRSRVSVTGRAVEPAVAAGVGR